MVPLYQEGVYPRAGNRRGYKLFTDLRTWNECHESDGEDEFGIILNMYVFGGMGEKHSKEANIEDGTISL